MYLLSRKIKAGGFKVVLSGEGADEIYGGYLFFHKAPSPRAFHECALFFFLSCITSACCRCLPMAFVPSEGAVPARVACVRSPSSPPMCLGFFT